jgi:prepilin-type N-terminal cleavage/methylation domain-containing protein
VSGLSRRLRRARSDEGGFTLVELVMTVSIVGVIVAGLAGVVIRYLQDTVSASARLNESHDVQFAAAYWQRDVSSIGVRSTTYDPDPAKHTYALQQSVNVTPACALPTGTPVVTFAWTQYHQLDDPDHPATVTVSYLAQATAGIYRLTRVRCTGATVDSTVVLARELTAVPAVTCTGAGVSGCDDGSGKVPTLVTMSLSVHDPEHRGQLAYTAVLTGGRRQT